MPLLTGWDWLVLVIGLVSTALGFWRGAVRTLFGLGAWIVAVIASPFVVSFAVPGLAGVIDLAAIPVWVLFIVAFLVVFVVVRLAGNLLLRGIRSIGLGGVDRAFGGALGVARAALIIMVAALIGYRLGMAQESAWTAARTRPMLDWMVAHADPLLPASTSPGGQGGRSGSTSVPGFLPDLLPDIVPGGRPVPDGQGQGGQRQGALLHAVPPAVALAAGSRQQHCGA